MTQTITIVTPILGFFVGVLIWALILSFFSFIAWCSDKSGIHFTTEKIWKGFFYMGLIMSFMFSLVKATT